MKSGFARVQRIKRGILHFAEVSLIVDTASDTTLTTFTCSGEGFVGPGIIEDMPGEGPQAQGYKPWRDAASLGVKFALEVAGIAHAEVDIDRISGRDGIDTNPTIVAVCAAQATWNALEFYPPDDVVESIETLMFGSFNQPLDHLPIMRR